MMLLKKFAIFTYKSLYTTSYISESISVYDQLFASGSQLCNITNDFYIFMVYIITEQISNFPYIKEYKYLIYTLHNPDSMSKIFIQCKAISHRFSFVDTSYVILGSTN